MKRRSMKLARTARLSLTCRVLTAMIVTVAMHGQAHVSLGTLTLPTYQEGSPDPNPPFDRYTSPRFIYPYSLHDVLTNERRDTVWRAVFLENEYLRCTILPDMGGRIYTCVDKRNNVPMFYANPSIKKSSVAYRGAWAAFGEEFNFPVSHTWITLSPVDFSTRTLPDGSAAVTVGNIDRVYGMQWSVEMVLHPGSTVLEQNVTLSNRSDTRHRFYWWSNTAIQTWDDSLICYPQQFTAAHGFADVDTWPIDAHGTDLSRPGNHLFGPVSRFVHASREPYMGVWHPHTNAGAAHFARFDELPGKKFWSWGGDADGLDWRKALSDDNSQYVEVQGGLFRNQETYAFLQPRETIHFSEYWMPLRELGGLSRANLAASLFLSRAGDTLHLALNANSRIPAAHLRVRAAGLVLLDQTVDLDPTTTWKHDLPLAHATGKATFELVDRHGAQLLTQTEGMYDWTPASEVKTGPMNRWTAPAPESRSAEDWLEVGRSDELNGRLLVAVEDYGRGLALQADSQPLHMAAGRLLVTLLRYEEALPHLSAALARDTANSEIAYYLGIAREGMRDEVGARLAFDEARRTPGLRAAANLRLAELEARTGRFADARRYAADAAAERPDDMRAAEVLAVLDRAADPARKSSSAMLDRFPLSAVLAEEAGRPDLAHLASDTHRILELAGAYIRLGRYEQALNVLSRSYPDPAPGTFEAGAVAPSADVQVAYLRAWTLHQLGRESDSAFALAAALPAQLQFPSGAVSLAVLEDAVAWHPRDATALTLLGDLEYAVGLTASGLHHWQTASDIRSDLPTLEAQIGMAELQDRRDPSAALAAFERGIRGDAYNVRNYMGADQSLRLLRRPAADRVASLSRYPTDSPMPPRVAQELALARAETGDFDGAEELFRHRFFPREENGTNVREVWIEIRLLGMEHMAKQAQCSGTLAQARSLAQPVAGLDFTQDGLQPFIESARSQYRLGAALETCGQHADASRHFRAAAEQQTAENMVWAHRAAKRLPSYNDTEWHERLQGALTRARANVVTSNNTGWWTFTVGLLQAELGDRSASLSTFDDALRLPENRNSYHQVQLALQP